MTYLKHAALWFCGGLGAGLGWQTALWLWGRLT